MKIKMILFDLDGTLLPMDQDIFMKAYFGGLAKKLAPAGYTDKKQLIDAIWAGTAAMIANDGSRTNEERFWERFEAILGKRVREDKYLLDDFYLNEFESVREVCGYDPKAAQTVAWLKDKGYRVSLATNPFFPHNATQSRLRWSGVAESDVEWLESYENSHYCKPNPAYFTEVTEILGVAPEECLMVGNDAKEDMIAETLGMKVFLLTDCLINKENKDLSHYPQGSFDELIKYIENIE